MPLTNDPSLVAFDPKKNESYLFFLKRETPDGLAIVLGDCRSVARLTCETARLRDAIRLAKSVVL